MYSTIADINAAMEQAREAFYIFRNKSLSDRANFMRAIAGELEAAGDELIKITMQETNLPEARLRGERARTIFQLHSYADACEKGDWLEIRIDTANPAKTPPKPDIRKMNVPLGPVVVFGASNFPYAYSTAGGDTASAFAAGCPVVVKGHPAHPKTSERVAEAIMAAAVSTGMPEGVFAHIAGASIETGKALVMHPFAKAVGFTGSYIAGKQLFDWANERKEPIPVFAEMGSVNPVFLLPEKLSSDAENMAAQYAGSITLGVGQFCTNPGLIIGVEGPGLTMFIHELGNAIEKITPAPMLHQGIATAYVNHRINALAQANVELVAQSASEPTSNLSGTATIATVEGKTFLNNPVLHKEVFGPYSLVVRCADINEMFEIANRLEGQLTATIMATEEDIRGHVPLLESIKNICGRLVLNGVPTGVEVCAAMHHGGPFPATTDSRFTSVGEDAIKRFVRPVSFQNWPEALLPDGLKNQNPLKVWRMVNDEWSNRSGL